MSWELQALLAVVVVIGVARITGSFIRLIKRIIFWARAKKYNYTYLPHAGSDKPWRQNTRGVS
jgi:glutamine synthetase adenylyltransferase